MGKTIVDQIRIIVSNEMKKFYEPKNGKNWLKAIIADADAFVEAKTPMSNYEKGERLVESGCFAVKHVDQRPMLIALWGEKTIDSYSPQDLHSTYRHLIAREYATLREEEEENK